MKIKLGVGISYGVDVIAHEKTRRDIITVIPDDNKKYMSTDLNKSIDLNSEFISNKTELLGYEFTYSES